MRCATRFAVAFTCVAVLTVNAQNTPTPSAKSFCIKIQPGKYAEFMKLMTDVSKPVAQVHADAGEFSARFLMRAVYPAGWRRLVTTKWLPCIRAFHRTQKL